MAALHIFSITYLLGPRCQVLNFKSYEPKLEAARFPTTWLGSPTNWQVQKLKGALANKSTCGRGPALDNGDCVGMQQDMSLNFFQDHSRIPIKQSMSQNSINQPTNPSMSRVIPISPGTRTTEGETLQSHWTITSWQRLTWQQLTMMTAWPE